MKVARKYFAAAFSIAFLLPSSWDRPSPGAGEVSPAVYRIAVDGSINPAVAEFIEESIQRTHDDGARALVIQLDTPGGLLSSTRTIVKGILGAPVPVIVYVAPSGAGAGSAGMFITLAAHVAAMGPGTNIGAAHPMGVGGQEAGGVMGEKIENFVASWSEAIARQRERNVEWVVRAVRESSAITSAEALKLNVVDIVAGDVRDLFEQSSGKQVAVPSGEVTLALFGARVQTLEMRLSQKVLDMLANPNVAYLLFMAGILGLYLEFTNPGLMFPGVAGALCLLLALTAFQSITRGGAPSCSAQPCWWRKLSCRASAFSGSVASSRS